MSWDIYNNHYMYWRIVAPLKRSVSIGFAGPCWGAPCCLISCSKIQLQLYENKITISSTVLVCTDLLFLINKYKSTNISLSSAYYPVRIAMLFIANIYIIIYNYIIIYIYRHFGAPLRSAPGAISPPPPPPAPPSLRHWS